MVQREERERSVGTQPSSASGTADVTLKLTENERN